ncbi:MAG: hypothetical protein M1824_001777 [Vezdaea acicularis]|nr:MAG: hypothetical protein M1824_001777 [Vezdaea acicularis]
MSSARYEALNHQKPADTIDQSAWGEAKTSNLGSATSIQLTPASDFDAGTRLPRKEQEIDNIEESIELTQVFGTRDRIKRSANQHEYEEDLEGEYRDSEGSDHSRRVLPSRGRSWTEGSFVQYTPEEERAVVRKLDRNLVLFIALLYMLSFLDRSNIGNASVAGLKKDLDLTSSQYEWLLTAFYITYILFEWMTLMYKVVPAHIYISLCVFFWGLIASLQSLATSFWSLVTLRALLGITEAAFGPGVPFYLSFFFRRDELALRTGLFISAAPLAISFASSLGWAITKLGEKSSFAPWRLLFLIEGYPSVLVAVFAWMYIPDGPGQTIYFTRKEKKIAQLRLGKSNNSQKVVDGLRGLDPHEILETLCEPKSYLTAMMFFSCNVAFSSLPVFLPTIINEMGYSALSSQALSAPPYLAAFIIVILTAYLSDRFCTRGLFIALHAGMSALGYALIAIAGHRGWGNKWRYAAIYPAATGFFSCITLIITWTINNSNTDSKKGTGVAMLNIIGQLGPLLGTRLYPEQDKPFYVRGMLICSGFMLFTLALTLGLRFVLKSQNRSLALTRPQTQVQKVDEPGLMATTDIQDIPEKFMYML